MFGIYRFILATLVIITHTAPDRFVPGGFYAVFSFYMLSGYLMTYILNEQYGFSLRGIGRYLFNRALRIYPTYWVCFLCTLSFVTAVPWLTWQVSRNIVMPDSLIKWLSNIFIFGIGTSGRGRLIPQAWSLSVELLFYITIGVLLARKKIIVGIWFGLSVVCTIYMDMAGTRIADWYQPLGAGSLPFSIGAVVYYWRDDLTSASRAAPLISLFLYLLNIMIVAKAHLYGIEAGYYISIYLSALALITLRDVDKRSVPGRLGKWDDMMGNLSYPMYVSHFMVGIFVLWVFFKEPRGNGWSFTGVCYIYVLVFSYLIHRIFESRIDRIRKKVKMKRSPSSPRGGRT
jgi:peptidoglycan/LPS O-acetylase OafA/YrhL